MTTMRIINHYEKFAKKALCVAMVAVAPGAFAVDISSVNAVGYIYTDNDETGDPGLVVYAGQGANDNNYTPYVIAEFGVNQGGSAINTALTINGATDLDNTVINGSLTATGTTLINASGGSSTTIGNSTFTLNNQTTITGSTDGTDAGLILNGWTNNTSVAGIEANSNGDVNITANNDNLGTGPEAINLVAGATSSASLSVGADGDGANGFITLNGPTTTINTESFLVDTGTSTITATDSSASVSAGTGASFTSYSSGQTVSAASLNNGDAASKGLVDGVVVRNRINGDTLFDGDVYINGSLTYSSASSAQTVVTDIANSTSGEMTIVKSGETGAVVDANGKITTGAATTEATASLTVTNDLNNTHGIIVTETQTTISGGQYSSSLTMDDNGATFSDSATGTPIQVHGVNDGTADFDAVNVRQFAGAIAAAAAMTNIPQVPMGQKGTFGFGAASFMGKSAIAMGTSYRFSENGILKASASVNNGGKQRPIISIGAGWSW